METNKITELPKIYAVYAETEEQARILTSKQKEIFRNHSPIQAKTWYRFDTKNNDWGFSTVGYEGTHWGIEKEFTFDEWNKLINMPKYTVSFCKANKILIKVNNVEEAQRVIDIVGGTPEKSWKAYVEYYYDDIKYLNLDDKTYSVGFHSDFWEEFKNYTVISFEQFIKDNTEMEKRDLKAGDYVYIQYDRSEDSKMFNRQVKKVTRVHNHALEVEGGQGGIHFDEVRLATKREIESMTGKKVIGYKAPYDINDFIKKDDLMVDAELLTRKDFVKKGQTGNGSQYYLSSELVKSIFIPVYEEVIKSKSVPIGQANRTIIIYSDGRIEGERNYKIKAWENILEKLKEVYNLTAESGSSYSVSISTVKIGCEEHVSINQLQTLVNTFYELNPRSK